MAVGTVNIGDRQSGRLQAESIINCSPERESIKRAIQQLYDPRFRAALPGTVNPYGNGGASERIAKVLKESSLDGIVKKRFYDLLA